MKAEMTIGTAMAVLTLAVAAGNALAQDIPETELNVVGSISSLSQYKDFEVPFWSETIPEASGGKVTATLSGFDELGLKGGEVLRLIGQGVIQIGAPIPAYLAADDPTNEILEMPGLSPDAATARKMAAAAEPVYARMYEEKFGVKLLALAAYPGQMLFCNAEIAALADIAGKKVRVSGRAQSEFIDALGGTPVTLAFGEVVPALQNKVADCAITGTLPGYSAKWYEVATHLYGQIVTWGHLSYAVNLDFWNGLDPALQNLLQTEMDALEETLWQAAAEQTDLGVACNTGGAGCTLEPAGTMTLVEPSEGDREALVGLLKEKLLPAWAARCSEDCVTGFNETVGRLIDVKL
ncbi:MAG: TRAP transporter substrate-binding protein [Alphaproteobacteria bacterium]